MQTAHLNSIYQPNTKYVLANAICLHFCCLTVAIFPVLRVPPNIFFSNYAVRIAESGSEPILNCFPAFPIDSLKMPGKNT